MSKVKLNKDNLEKILNEFKYGLAIVFVKSNAFEARLVSAALGVSKEELKAMEKEDIDNIRERFGKGRR